MHFYVGDDSKTVGVRPSRQYFIILYSPGITTCQFSDYKLQHNNHINLTLLIMVWHLSSALEKCKPSVGSALGM